MPEIITDKNGSWKIYDNNIRLLFLPSEKWKLYNSGTWLEVPATATAGEIILIKANQLPAETTSFVFEIGGLNETVPVANSATETSAAIDVQAQPGDTLDVTAIHPIYGNYTKVVKVV